MKAASLHHRTNFPWNLDKAEKELYSALSNAKLCLGEGHRTVAGLESVIQRIRAKINKHDAALNVWIEDIKGKLAEEEALDGDAMAALVADVEQEIPHGEALGGDISSLHGL